MLHINSSGQIRQKPKVTETNQGHSGPWIQEPGSSQALVSTYPSLPVPLLRSPRKPADGNQKP